jgi:SAM-dependent methyltransferase
MHLWAGSPFFPALIGVAMVIALALAHRSAQFISARLAGLVASLVQTLNGPHARTAWLNLGLWPARTYAHAARALATHVGRAAGIGKGAAVLDVGCGFGESLLLWLSDEFGAARAVGINASAAEAASARLGGEAATVVCADGARLPAEYADGSFDAVVSIDAAYHFRTRDDFLECAWSALRPGGRLATADVVASSGCSAGLGVGLRRAMYCALAGIPRANLRYGAGGYARRLHELGFEDVMTEDLTEHVLGGFGHWGAGSPSFGVRMAAQFIRGMRAGADVSFVVVRAVKPPRSRTDP